MTPRASPEAEQDLDDIEAWLMANRGPQVAANTIEAVLMRIAALEDAPYSGSLRSEYGDAVRLVAVGRYMIYFEAAADSLTILRILHAARDRDSIMRGVQEEATPFVAA
jgi:toxin ParE1/3/4